MLGLKPLMSSDAFSSCEVKGFVDICTAHKPCALSHFQLQKTSSAIAQFLNSIAAALCTQGLDHCYACLRKCANDMSAGGVRTEQQGNAHS